ncbi:MAG: choice-of-anchor B family protein [Bacteroidota bacterium]
MKKFNCFIIGIVFLTTIGNAQLAQNMKVLSKWNNPNLPKVDGDQIWNDCTGWKDTIKNKEYFIAGSTDSIYVFEVTDPNSMLFCDVKPGRAKFAINRDYETYSHYLYTVSDRTSGTGALQIFDLQYLPDSIVEVFNNDTFGSSTHTIFIEAASKRLYMCTNILKPAGISAMDVLSLQNPEKPTFLGRLNPPQGSFIKVHEMYARNDTAYLSAENAGLYIYDYRNPSNPLLISSINPPYPQAGYNHSAWIDSTGKWLIFTDENQGLGIKLYDISDIRNPSFKTVWNSNTKALPHNAYWKGGYVYVSSYEDGVYVYDLRNPEKYQFPGVPPVVAFYDTYPKNAPGVYTGFHGCWGVWPYLPSGNILASDISEGLFVLNTLYPLSVKHADMEIVAGIYPNPVQDELSIKLRYNLADELKVTVYNMQGKRVAEKNFYLQNREVETPLSINTGLLDKGIYMVQLDNGYSQKTIKLIK